MKPPRTLEEWKERRRQPRPFPPPAALREGRCIRRRPRSDDEWAAMLAVSLARRERWLASGKLERLGPHEWRFHFGDEKLREYERRQRGQ